MTAHIRRVAALFQGLTVVSFESRMAAEMIALIERYGGRPLVVPAIREVQMDDNPAALQFGDRLTTGTVDLLILLTGVGTTLLFDLLKTRFSWSLILEALKKTAIVARGPKPVAALKAFGLRPTLTVPEPNTWVDLIAMLDKYRSMKGLRVAVQEYGVSNPALLEALTTRGAEVVRVPIYRWTLPENLEPLKLALDEVIAGNAAVMLITNAAQVEHVMKVLEQEGEVSSFLGALKKMIVASIGPTASDRLRQHGWPIDFEPSHSKMGVLVKETAELAPGILEQKSRS